MKMVALIPARAGSKRIPGKNTKLLAGHPLIYYTIQAALESGCFYRIVVSTEDFATAAMVKAPGWAVYVRQRPVELATDDSLDFLWVRDVFENYPLAQDYDAFAILRPTSPFRTARTIRRAYDQFRKSEVHSMRAVQPVKEHPGKMWQYLAPGYPIIPLIGKTWPANTAGAVGINARDDRPWHSLPTQTLPKVYVQNASLEMAWRYVIPAFGTISGKKIAPFFTEGYEGFDLNTMDDWREAERLIAEGCVELPAVSLAPETSAPASI